MLVLQILAMQDRFVRLVLLMEVTLVVVQAVTLVQSVTLTSMNAMKVRFVLIFFTLYFSLLYLHFHLHLLVRISTTKLSVVRFADEKNLYNNRKAWHDSSKKLVSVNLTFLKNI